MLPPSDWECNEIAVFGLSLRRCRGRGLLCRAPQLVCFDVDNFCVGCGNYCSQSPPTCHYSRYISNASNTDVGLRYALTQCRSQGGHGCMSPSQLEISICLRLLGASLPDPHRGSAPGPRWGTSVPRPPLLSPRSKFLAAPLSHWEVIKYAYSAVFLEVLEVTSCNLKRRERDLACVVVSLYRAKKNDGKEEG